MINFLNRRALLIVPAFFIGSKMVVSLAATKLLIDEAGLAFYDTISIILTASSLFFVLNFTFSTRFRRLLRDVSFRRSVNYRKDFLRLQARTRAHSIALFAMAIGVALLLPGDYPVLLSIALLLGCSVYLSSSEYLAGYLGRQNWIRFIEFSIAVFFLGLGYAGSNVELLAFSLFASTPAARLIFITYYTRSIPFTPNQFRLSYRQRPSSESYFSGTTCAAIGNLIQSLSTVILHSFVYLLLPEGSMTAVNLSYRFVGPVAAFYNFLSYLTNNRHSLQRSSRIIIWLSLTTLLLSMFSNYFSSLLFPDVRTLSFLLFFLAGCHVILNGLNVTISSVVYQEGRYRSILLASLPFAVSTLLAGGMVSFAEIQNPIWFIILLMSASLIELIIQYRSLRI